MHKYEQRIQKIEDISEEAIKIWIAQDSISNYLLEDLLRLTLPKVTEVGSQLGVHEVTVILLEPVDYRTIVEGANAWGELIARPVGPP